MSRSAFFALFATMAFSGCAPAYNIVDKSGASMFEIKKGVCFVGCNVKLVKADGQRCRGYAAGLEEGQSASIWVYCPDEAHKSLSTEPLARYVPVVGTLAPLAPLAERNQAAAEAALRYARQYPE